MMTFKNKEFSHWLISLVILLSPLFFWQSQFYQVGGDDSKIYYLFPNQLLDQFVFNLYTKNGPGILGVYGSHADEIPFLVLIKTFKTLLPFLNTQNLLYGLNLAFGYLGIIFLFRELQGKRGKFSLELVFGLFYILSNFCVYSLWRHQLFPLYLISIIPVSLLFFVKALRTNRAVFTLLSSFVLSLFAILFMSVPWTVGTVICLTPVLVYLFQKYRLVFLKHFTLLAFLLVLLNAYWLFHFVFSVFSSAGGGSDIISTSITFEKSMAAADIMRNVTRDNVLLYPLLNQFHLSVQPRDKYLMLATVFPLIIFIKFVFVKRKNLLHLSLFISWFLSLYFFTVKITGDSGLNLFLWINAHLRGFNMFRFMYDKFGYVLALSSSLLLASSLDVLTHLRSLKMYRLIIILLVLIQIWLAKPFVFDDYHHLPIPGTQIYSGLSDFNSDYYDLVQYLKNSTDESKIAWLPLNIANYTPIRDATLADHFYFGISPLVFFADKNDLTGFSSLGQSETAMSRAILSGNTEEVAKIFQHLNVNYFLLNHDIPTDVAGSYLFPGGIYEKQMRPEVLKKLLGRKIIDFGTKYSLYEINPSYHSNRFGSYVLSSKKVTQLSAEAVSDYYYQLRLEVTSEDQLLSFLETGSNQWQLSTPAGNRLEFSRITSDGYGNHWLVPANICNQTQCEILNGQKIAQINLQFKPAKYDWYVTRISILTFIGVMTYFFWAVVAKIKSVISTLNNHSKP